MTLPSPVKLVYDDDAMQALDTRANHDVNAITIKKIVESLYPDPRIQIPKAEDCSTSKPPELTKWNKPNEDVVSFLRDFRRKAEVHIRRRRIRSEDDYFDSLRESVSIPELAAWHKQHEQTYGRDCTKLMNLLVSHFHDITSHARAFNRLVSLPVYDERGIENLLSQFELLAPQCGNLLTEQGALTELIRHINPTIATRLQLHAVVARGASTGAVVASLRQDCSAALPAAPLVNPTPPHYHAPAPAPALTPGSPQMNVEAAVELVSAVFDKMNQSGRFNYNNTKKPNPKARVPGSSGQVCRLFRDTGSCRFGEKCIHMHTTH